MRPQVELEAVRPGGGEGAEELRLGAAVLPLRLRIDQAVVEFLQVFFAPPNPDEGDGELINWADEDDTALGDAEGPDCLAEDDAGGFGHLSSLTDPKKNFRVAQCILHAHFKSPCQRGPETGLRL